MPAARARSHREDEAPVQLDGGEVASQAGERLHRDDEQRGAHRHRHRQVAEQDQCGHDEESPSCAHQDGHHADDQTVDDDPPQRQLAGVIPVHRCLCPPALQHGQGGRHHHQGERDGQHVPGQMAADETGEEGTGHPGKAEQQSGAPLHATGSRMAGHTGERGDPDQHGQGQHEHQRTACPWRRCWSGPRRTGRCRSPQPPISACAPRHCPGRWWRPVRPLPTGPDVRALRSAGRGGRAGHGEVAPSLVVRSETGRRVRRW